MLDVRGSIAQLRSTTEHHFQHIKNQHDFMRIWAVQFELGYTDFRTIQMALQLDGKIELLKRFAKDYDQFYHYEYAFAAGGLAGFNEQFGSEIAAYDQAHQTLIATLDEISRFQPAADEDSKLV